MANDPKSPERAAQYRHEGLPWIGWRWMSGEGSVLDTEASQCPLLHWLALTGLDLFGALIPRALPWAAIVQAFGLPQGRPFGLYPPSDFSTTPVSLFCPAPVPRFFAKNSLTPRPLFEFITLRFCRSIFPAPPCPTTPSRHRPYRRRPRLARPRRYPSRRKRCASPCGLNRVKAAKVPLRRHRPPHCVQRPHPRPSPAQPLPRRLRAPSAAAPSHFPLLPLQPLPGQPALRQPPPPLRRRPAR
jgi:hypothetical protein